MTATYFFFILILDLSLYVTRKQVGIFYLPMLIETLILLIGIVLLFFGFPERLFPQSKVINLYFCSSILFTILMVNFLFETQVILYYTFKSNSNYLTNEGEWWDLKNIYNN